MSRLLRSLKFTDETGCCNNNLFVGLKAMLFAAVFAIWGVSSAYAQTEFPCEISIECPGDVSLECGADIEDWDLTGYPVINEENCFGEIVVTHSDNVIFQDGTCLVVINRTWTASVIGGPSAVCSQTITVADTEGPVFVNEPADALYQCIGDVPPAEELETTDCGDLITTTIFEPNDVDTLICTLSTPVGPGPDWAVWLNGLTSLGLASNDYYRWVAGSASMEYHNDGTAYLTGTVENMTNPAEQWVVHFWMQNGKNWSDWSALGRSYKDDLGFGAAHYEDWTYYELVPVFSHFVGAGANAGSEIYLSHQPANYYFGFQFGVGANNRNGNDGGSGWFYYWGNVDGESVSNHGDLTVDKSCVPVETPDTDCEYTVLRLWNAIDECGNVNFADQTITIHDTTPPVFENCPADISIECGDEIPALFPVEELIAIDNCGDDVLIEFLSELTIQGENNCSYSIQRRYRATDVCGNSSECQYSVYVSDNTAPELTVPADATFECDEEIDFGVASAYDVCQGEIDVMMGEPVFYEDDCYGYWTILYTANDGCGNVSTGTQTIYIEDTTAPVFNEFEVQVYVECDEVDDVEIPGATDNCDEEVTVTYVDITNSGGCLGVIMRTFTAVDECGNEATAVQYIYIQDTTPAVIDEPADQTVECDAVPAAPGEEGADIYDNCGYEVTVEFHTEIQEGECENSYTILWIWEAWDYCENYSTDTTVITVVDTTNPWLEVPQGGSFSCDEEIVYGEASASDNCDEDVTITYSDVETPGECPQEYTVVRTWVAVDNCGNSSTGSATYYVYDDEAPEFTSVPENITIECDQDIPVTEASAVDNCSENVTITSEDVYEVQGECYSLIIRTFTAEDECGNWSTASHTITIVDTTAPVISGDIEIFLPCEDYAGIFVTATDNCSDDVTIIVVSDEEVSGGCAGRYIRTYGAYDECDNYSEFEQFITLVDETAPEITNAPADITVECGDEIPGYTPIWEDNCDDELTLSAISSIAWDGCNQIITQVYFAVDHCNNEASVDRVITIVDTTDPYFEELPSDITIECYEEVPAVVVPMAYDICDEDVDVEVTDDIIPGNCPNEYTIARVYRAYDDCGNEAVETRYIYVEDNYGPVFDDQPFLYSYECDDEIPVIEPTAEDACGSYEIDYVDFWFEESDCAGYFSRIWTAVDECGNESQFAQFINIYDETAPVIEGDIEIEMPCDQVSYEILVTATDNCDEDVEIEIVSDELVSGACAGRLMRIYHAYDDCGNWSEFTQFITLIDETAPVADNIPADAEYECDEEWSAATVNFTDNCDEDLILTANVQIETDGCTTVYHYIWTAMDHCENTTVVEQHITVTDTTYPVASFDPEDFTVECGSFWDLMVPTFSDNCDEDLTLDSGSSEEMVGCNTVLTFWWSATDDCGNTTTVGNTVTIEDTTPPMLYAPQGGEFSCDEELVWGEAFAYDLCDEEVEVTYTEEIIPGECPQSYTIERTYVAVDDCDNFATAVVSVYVYDNEDPEFTFVPEDITIECSDEVPASDASAVDNCDEQVVVSQNDIMEYESDCYTVIVREFIAEDDCGNMAYAYQNIYVVDTTDPIIEGEVEIEMPCDEISYEIFVTATDNCDEDVEITILSDEAASGSCAGRIIRTYIAYDNCQNWSTFTQFITLTDDEAPVANIDPQDLVVECGDEYSVAEVSFTDNCDEELTLFPDLFVEETDCAIIYHYVWTAIDHCDNVATVDQYITIQDTTDPIIYDQDSESTVDCNVVIDFAIPSAWDACDEDVEVVPTYTSEPGECPGEYTETITFTAYDDCGNSSSVTHIVHHEDTEAPMLTNIPEGGNYECDEDLPMDMPSAFDYCSEATVDSDEYIIPGQCPNSYTVVRVFWAYDECGNYTDEVEVYYNVYDETDPYFTTEVSDEYYECIDWEAYVPQSVSAMDNCSEPTVETDIEAIDVDNCGNGEWMVTYTATDACWNTATISYMIYVQDETEPVLSETPADLMLDCGDELPEAPEVSATDNCDNDVYVSMTETCMGDCPEEGEEDCDISTPVRPAGNPCLYPVDWAMALFAMPSSHKWYQLVPGSGSFSDNGDGTVTISGTLVNAYNPNAGFTFSVNFVNGLDWAAWSSQAFPTGFKADCGGEASNHESWIYYILQAGEGAELVGWGDYAGSAINLTHAPANLYFGFQYGDGANNYNGDYGFGGWFSYNGVFLVDGEPIMSGNASGAGDFAFEVDCCPDYTIERCWTAIDCSGNTTSWCQTISYGDLDTDAPTASTIPVEEEVKDGDIAIVSIQPNPANANSQISFMSQNEGRLSLQIMDMTGRIIADLFNSDVEAGVVYKTDFDASTLPAGVYMVRLNSGTETDIDRIQIAK